VQQFSDDTSRPLPIELQATLNRKGTLAITGNVTATPLKLAVKVNANRLDAPSRSCVAIFCVSRVAPMHCLMREIYASTRERRP
jgi:hypothetical protein